MYFSGSKRFPPITLRLKCYFTKAVEITYGEPTCRHCLAKQAGLWGLP